jgi:tetratricopeptide (TPR) repeat protein
MGQIKQKKTDLNKTKFLYLLCAVAVLSALSFFNIALYFTNGKPKINTRVLGTTNAGVTEIYYWKGLLDANPEYLEGWIELAKIEYKLGNSEEAKRAIDKAFDINPNSEELNKLRDSVNL